MRIGSFAGLGLASLLSWSCGGESDDVPLDDEDAGAVVAGQPSAADSGAVEPGRPDSGGLGTPSLDAGAARPSAGLDASARADASTGPGRAQDAGNAEGGRNTDAGSASSTDAGGASGTDAGGSGACDWSDPPSDVAAWINESWNAQLGSNIKGRKAWNLDNVMLNKGQLNLCVRWGATTAVPETLRTNLEATTERWFNDWFKGLGDYGCFPYGSGIKVKITGWAVRPGKEALLGAVDPSTPIYTETDAEGEPKCPDACSSFVHWDHKFPDCKAGAANHSDYWLWFDDQLPGGGGAAAVGGDWGLRMPVGTFVGAFANKSFMICEHEMGHGFGFQDYYDWTGSRPKDGSIMIVGSTMSQAPTTADIWLLRRTWKEMKALRGW